MRLPDHRLLRFLTLLLVGGVFMWFISRVLIPTPTFSKPSSTILESREGHLIGARIAADGQWRFPPMDSVPERFATCLLLFEDQNFYRHPGVDPISIIRALRENIKAGKVVQGGSTLSMQLARIHSEGQARTYGNKALETLKALHMEVNWSKDEILALYSSHAPFGGNVVGMETAAWRYFGRDPWSLSWAESATLAVLPNAPSLIYPGKGQERLLKKRDRLLGRLFEEGLINSEELALAMAEPLPQRPKSLPDHARHYLERCVATRSGQRVRSTLDDGLQRQCQRITEQHLKEMSGIEVYNGALLILDTKTQDILAYIGNTTDTDLHNNAVDCAAARRSTGSIIKPLLYAHMIQAGELTPKMLIPDIPSSFTDYAPENYHGDYDGVVAAEEALWRSLNIPFVRLLKDYGIGRFHGDLRAHGLSTVDRPASHYGLALMLGGAEVRLDQITAAYAKMGARLLDPEVDHPLDRWSIHHTFSALRRLNRPESREYQRSFDSHRTIAWKTGTSFGFKDAWAVGVTPDYTIGVWIGNADGEGRTGLSGVRSAAPLLFDALDLLPSGSWFDTPMEGGALVETCARSGRPLGPHCPLADTLELSLADYSSLGVCRYHELVHLSPDRKHSTRIGCIPGQEIVSTDWFVLPPVQEYYYEQKHSDYRPLPPLMAACGTSKESMAFEYPGAGQKIYIPKEFGGDKGRLVSKLAHRYPDIEVYWYLDSDYLGSTSSVHEMPILCEPGPHILMVVDESGEEERLRFEVVGE